MPTTLLGPYTRTIMVAAVIAATLAFALSGVRSEVHGNLLPLFEWMETTWLGYIGKTWGGAFATIQAGHLVGMALLGGSVLVADSRLLGIFLTDTDQGVITARCNQVFNYALAVTVASGIFMACGVAVKIYYLPVYWYKMLAFGAGILFHYLVRQPLVERPPGEVNPWLLKLIAVASIMIWFTVAATGRWIGFSG